MNTDAIPQQTEMFDFALPTRIILESGCLSKLHHFLSEAGKRKALVVLSEGAKERHSSIAEILNSKRKDLEVTPYFLKKNFKASTDELHEIKCYLDKNDYDAIVSVGGGNIIDFVKVAAIALDPNVNITTCVGKSFDVVERKLFHVAVPTTFGTGSEVTKGAIILDNQTNQKDGVRGNAIFPDLAIIDPALGSTLPDNVLRETLFDSFTHSFEALHAEKRNPLTRMLAINALRMISQNIERYTRKETDNTFYYQAAFSSLLGGFCICHNSTCLPHRFEQAFSPFYRLSHGAGLAAIYPAWVAALEKEGKIDPLLSQVSHNKTATEYVAHILSQLNLSDASQRLDEITLPPSSMAERVTGNIANDPLINGHHGDIVVSLLQTILAKP
ncbi:iron-containing alcohol dehydrogenase [Erwinia piriflorinigrans]|uniref:NADPH-dependent butanol dehydrogenase BDH n=1 Tax=Erwinia piriflorinigrans CFBP 5888 TaxID=1161919 RepID=V5Z9L9_9GAMM|nr:iron-containing alcohol dehydrogenase [Erwinia piriflorinigrans]CCG88048.1 NADPH-dependent butanol dehydrogenase BDH [Erwinia piriflorinigrans CFBP 5888]